ncbi:MAG TPA: hypothetical protein V6D05_03125 [Stenomitos sp.]
MALEFYDDDRLIFACTLECVDRLIDVGVESLAASDYLDVWVCVPNPKADEETLQATGHSIPVLRQRFAAARAEIDRLEAAFGLLPLPPDSPFSLNVNLATRRASQSAE